MINSREWKQALYVSALKGDTFGSQIYGMQSRIRISGNSNKIRVIARLLQCLDEPLSLEQENQFSDLLTGIVSDEYNKNYVQYLDNCCMALNAADQRWFGKLLLHFGYTPKELVFCQTKNLNCIITAAAIQDNEIDLACSHGDYTHECVSFDILYDLIKTHNNYLIYDDCAYPGNRDYLSFSAFSYWLEKQSGLIKEMWTNNKAYAQEFPEYIAGLKSQSPVRCLR